MTKPERRKQYLIDRKIQFSFLRALLISILIISVFFGYFLIKINDHLTETLVMQYSGPSIQASASSPVVIGADVGDLRAQLRQRDLYFILQIALVIILMGVLVGWYAIRFSHRIAGPVYRLKKSLDDAIAGDYSVRISLRKRDFLKDIADKMNQLLEALDKK